MYDLIIYDTSNFTDFPIGGQLTSIRNFLKYIANFQPDFADKILLMGITSRTEEVGVTQKVEIDGKAFSFLPVLYRDRELSNVQKSLRIEYLKALLRNRKMISVHKKALHYIHTPEAYIAVKCLHPFARTAVFSHGSFFNMADGFRFFQNNKLVLTLFNQFLILLIKSADLLFVLDDDSQKQYSKYTSKVCRAENSIIVPDSTPERSNCHSPIRLLFVGRLSKVKRIDSIIRAVECMDGKACLTVIGDGEERQMLEALVSESKLKNQVTFLGSLSPENVGTHMRTHDILIMNSSMEGKPMTILEAMSYGMPVVTTPVGGIPELVYPGENGEFTDGSPHKISDKVQLVCSCYQDYAKECCKLSKQYDYKEVNHGTFHRLQELLK